MRKKICNVLFAFTCLLILIPTVILAAWNNGGGTGDTSGPSGRLLLIDLIWFIKKKMAVGKY